MRNVQLSTGYLLPKDPSRWDGFDRAKAREHYDELPQYLQQALNI